MIGLDTNVLVRYIVRDDPRQTAAATRLIESRCKSQDPGFVPMVVLCELVWVLERGYGYGRPVILTVLRRLLSADDLHLESAELVWQALNLYEQGKADFSDYMIGLSGRENKAEITYTFDRRAAGSALFKILPA